MLAQLRPMCLLKILPLAVGRAGREGGGESSGKLFSPVFSPRSSSDFDRRRTIRTRLAMEPTNRCRRQDEENAANAGHSAEPLAHGL